MKTNKNRTDLSSLIAMLKNEDSRYSKLAKKLFWVYLAMLPLFIGVSIFDYLETKDINVIFWCVFLVLSFMCFAILFKKYSKVYGGVNYSLPTLEMLKQAAHRYKLITKDSIWALMALVFMDIAFLFSHINDLSPWNIHFIFLGAMVFAAAIGLLVYYFKYWPLRKNALQLIKELES